MTKIVDYFKSSPLSRRALIFRLTIGTLISLTFIGGGIYRFVADPYNFGVVAFVPLGFILGFFTILWINPLMAEKWFVIKDEEGQSEQ